jgi:hypothetical protein
MVDDLIPEDVRDFIIRFVDSVAELEALLLLRGNPDLAWDAGMMAKRLYASEPEVAELLARLSEHGLLRAGDGQYRYECATAELSSVVDSLAVVYSRHLIPVTNMIHGKRRRIRQFADAFKFRKDR